jgi:hypothetical protein
MFGKNVQNYVNLPYLQNKFSNFLAPVAQITVFEDVRLWKKIYLEGKSCFLLKK